MKRPDWQLSPGAGNGRELKTLAHFVQGEELVTHRPYFIYSLWYEHVIMCCKLRTLSCPHVCMLHQWQAAVGWFSCLSVMALLVGLAYVLRETPAYSSVPHALYQGLHRPLWALAVTWIILACEEGYGGKP